MQIVNTCHFYIVFFSREKKGEKKNRRRRKIRGMNKKNHYTSLNVVAGSKGHGQPEAEGNEGAPVAQGAVLMEDC